MSHQYIYASQMYFLAHVQENSGGTEIESRNLGLALSLESQQPQTSDNRIDLNWYPSF